MPAASALADGLLARGSAREAVAHVEASTTASCPVVHAPDCGVCRYLSTCGATDAADAPPLAIHRATALNAEPGIGDRSPALLLPHGRAPPRA